MFLEQITKVRVKFTSHLRKGIVSASQVRDGFLEVEAAGQVTSSSASTKSPTKSPNHPEKKARQGSESHFIDRKTKALPNQQRLCALCTEPLCSKDQKAWLVGRLAGAKAWREGAAGEQGVGD